jgi:ParB family chromosome partitioning protein
MPVSKNDVRVKLVNINPADVIVSPKNRRIQALLNEGSVADILPSFLEDGQLLPIVVRQTADGKYELADGSRRLWCATFAERDVLAYVGPVPDEDMGKFSDVANLTKKISDYEEAMYFAGLIDKGVHSSWNEIGRFYGIHKRRQTSLKAMSELPAAIVESFTEPQDVTAAYAAELNSLCAKGGKIQQMLLEAASYLIAKKAELITMKVLLPEPREVMAAFRDAAKQASSEDMVAPKPKAPIVYESVDGLRKVKHSLSGDGKAVKYQLEGVPKDVLDDIAAYITKAAGVTLKKP